jgi:hypothetical protein
MTTKIRYGWRLFATGFSFFSFGLGGLLLWLLVFPALSALPGSRRQKVSRGQRVVHYSFYAFIGLMHRLGIMTYEIVGLEKLNRPGQLIIANHPTLVDIVFLVSRIKEASCIVKGSLWRNPFMRGPIVNAGYISQRSGENDRRVRRMAESGRIDDHFSGRHALGAGQAVPVPARRGRYRAAGRQDRHAGDDFVLPQHADQGRALVPDS